MSLICPYCKQVFLEANKYSPFCSERCQLLDFGKWAAEEYSVASEEAPDQTDLLDLTSDAENQ